MTLICVPCRFSSKRFEGKVVKKLLKKPIINWIEERLYDFRENHPEYDLHIYFFTDDERVKKCITKFPCLMTPSNIQNGTARILWGIQHYADIKSNIGDGWFINLQGDEPLFKAEHLELLLKEIRRKHTERQLTLCTPLDKDLDENDPNFVKLVLDLNGNILYSSRKPISRLLHIGVFAFNYNVINKFWDKETPLQIHENLEWLNILEYGYKIRAIKTSSATIGVNTQEDLEYLENMLKNELTNELK